MTSSLYLLRNYCVFPENSSVIQTIWCKKKKTMRNILIRLVAPTKASKGTILSFFSTIVFWILKIVLKCFSFSHWKNSSHCPACGGFRVACDNRMLHLLLLLSKNESKGRVGIVWLSISKRLSCKRRNLYASVYKYFVKYKKLTAMAKLWWAVVMIMIK